LRFYENSRKKITDEKISIRVLSPKGSWLKCTAELQ
jgi:hypothetical protein